MLSIGLMSGSQASYYLNLATDDYYTKGGEPPGRWWGEGAERFGLAGEVRDVELRHLFRGFSPGGDMVLARNAGSMVRRAGFDLTFSAPKSVSAAWACADEPTREIVLRCHARAVRAALGYVEDLCGFTRVGAQGRERERTGLLVAIFEHSTARVEGGGIPDPQLHSHCLVLNLARSADGVARTVDGRLFFRENLKMSAGALYRAELFAGLEHGLGLVASSSGGRIAELDLIPSSLRETFSKRRAAVLTHLHELGSSGTRSAAVAALDTRASKQQVDREAFFPEWQRVGREHGVTVETLCARMARPRRPNVEELLRGALDGAKARATEQASHFSERELVRFVAQALETCAVGADRIREAIIAELRESPDVVRVGHIDGDCRYTTREMLELEVALLTCAQALSAREHHVDSEVLVGVAASHPSMRPEQRRALEGLTQGSALALLRGMAGTGKTFTLAAARAVWEEAGYEVRGAALASTAAANLEQSTGIASANIHRTLALIDRGELTLGARTVLVVDEAGMVGTRQLEALAQAVEAAGAKLVLVGDDRQLQAIDAGAPFKALRETFGAAELTEILRQKESWARDVVHQIAGGQARVALERFRAHGQLVVAEGRDELLQQVVADFRRLTSGTNLERTLVLTGTRVQAFEANRAVQTERASAGELGTEMLEVGRSTFHRGDRVIFRRNSPLVLNGDRGVVTRVDPLDRLLTVKLDRGRRVTVDVESYTDVHLGYAVTTHCAQGQTLSNCLVMVGGSMQDREVTYVQASRATDETRLYIDAFSAGEELEQLVREMNRSRQKDMAFSVAANSDFDLELG